MLKTLRNLLIGTFLLASLSITAFANGYQQMPANTSIAFKIDPSNLSSETLKSYYKLALEFSIEDILESASSYNYDENFPARKLSSTSEFLTEYLLENPVYFSANTNNLSQQAAFFIEMSENNYNNQISPYLEAIAQQTTSENSYYTAPDLFVSHTNGYLIAASDSTYLEELTDFINCTNNCDNSLSDSSKFQNIEKDFLSESTFNLYISNVSGLLEEIFGSYGTSFLNTSTTSAIKEMGLSFKEKGNTYTISSSVETDSSILKSLGYDFSNTKKPNLYKKLPSGNALFFEDTTTIKNTIDALSTQLLTYNTYADQILLSLEDEMAFVIQDTGELFPTITFLAELDSNNTSNVKDILDEGSEDLWNELKSEANTINDNKITITNDPDTNLEITKSTTTIKGSTLPQYTFTVSLKNSKNPYAPDFSKDDLTFVITFGVTDGNLLFSTNKDIAEEYGKGLNLSSALDSKIDDNIDTAASLNTENIKKYLKKFFENLKDIVPTEADKFDDAIIAVDTLADPWGEIYITSKSTNSHSEGTLVINLDLDQLIEDSKSDKYQNLFESSSNAIDIIENANTDFDDVNTDTWYGDDVYYLSSHGIIKGYGDGTYKPEKQVTRAEFITILVRTLREQGITNSTSWYWGGVTDYYFDTEEYAWYSEYIMQAINEEIISTDSTNFRPGDPITRAEAAQMLANAINNFGIQVYYATDMNFYDVNGSNWFAGAVETVNANGIMSGKSAGRFAPYDKLTRAESAKIIRTLISNIDQL